MERLLTATDIMVKQVITLSPEAGALDGIRRLVNNRITGAPVTDTAGAYLGVFSEKCAMDGLIRAGQVYTGRHQVPRVSACDIMQTDILTLAPEMDAIEAIDLLLAHRVSGGPVVDPSGGFLGVFSEKTAMSVLLGAAYDRFPDTSVEAFMNPDPGRVVTNQDADLLSLAEIFLNTPYRRLVVLREGRVAGLIGRRDVLCAGLNLSRDAPEYLDALREGRGYSIGAVMDSLAETIAGDADIFRIAAIFQRTPYRRLPVLEGRSLIGLVSRRDLLSGARGMLTPRAGRREALPLYLSALADDPPPSMTG